MPSTWYARLRAQLGFEWRYILRGQFWLSLYQGAVLISLATLALLFGRFLPRVEYGEYSFILSAGVILSALSFSGLRTAIAQSVARGYEGSLFLAVRDSLRWSGLLVVGALSVALYYFAQDNDAYGICFLIVGATLPLLNTVSLSDCFLLGKKNFRASSIQKAIAALFLTVCMVAAVLLHAGLVALVATYFLSKLACDLVAYLWTIASYPPANARVEEGFMPHATILSGITFLATLADQADSIFLFLILGPASLALYSFAIAPAELAKGLIKNNISAFSFPILANRSPGEVRRQLWKYMLLGALAAAVGVAVYLLAAPLLFAVLLPKYIDAVPYAQLFSLSLVIVTAATFPITALRAMASTKRSYYNFLIVTETLQIAALFVGVWYFGIRGAIWAYLCMRFFRLSYAMALLYSH